MHVTKDAARVTHPVVLPVLAYLLLVRLYGRDEGVEYQQRRPQADLNPVAAVKERF